MGARPVEQKKGADKGIDGRIYFHEGPGATKQIVLQILTVEDLLTGKGIDRPPAQASATFKRAPKANAVRERPQALDFSGTTGDE